MKGFEHWNLIIGLIIGIVILIAMLYLASSGKAAISPSLAESYLRSCCSNYCYAKNTDSEQNTDNVQCTVSNQIDPDEKSTIKELADKAGYIKTNPNGLVETDKKRIDEMCGC